VKRIPLCVLLLLTGCQREIPFQPGISHCVEKMSWRDINKAMEWKRWRHQPIDAIYDPKRDPGPGESRFNDKNKPGRVYCENGLILSWDLNKVGTPPDYGDTKWTAHCYYVSVTEP
jgi:hypothetical protein